MYLIAGGFLIYLWLESSGCCELVLESLSSSVVSWQQVGVLRLAEHPREANLLLVAGWINRHQAAHLKQVYESMLSPKWVIGLGACALSAAAFANDPEIQNLQSVLPVNFFVPGCPPRWDDILKAISRSSKVGGQDRSVKDILNDAGSEHVF